MFISKCDVLTRRWRPLLVMVTPLLMAALPAAHPTPEARCGYVLLVMAVFWVTEALPLPVTALIPIFAFPLLGILPTNDVCMVYFKETNMMYMGGLMIAVAVEHCNLHKRIALSVILRVGQSTRQLMAGFMLVTMFLSMWISNMAATAMVVPILDAVLQELYKFIDKKESTEKEPSKQTAIELSSTSASSGDETPAISPRRTFRPPNQECLHLRDMMFLATAYGANLGGTGALTGTGPNLVLNGVLTSEYSEPTGLNFASWMGFNIPGMLICGLLAWIWLQIFFLGFRREKTSKSASEKENAIKKLISQKYDELGPMSFHELSVLLLFIILVILWMFRAPEFIDGWASLYTNWKGKQFRVLSATPAMLIAFLLFVLPTKRDFWSFRQQSSGSGPYEPLLTWSVVQEKLPWGILILMGGGFAMAKGVQASGLSTVIGEQLVILNVLPKVSVVFVICISTAMLTEVASNTATASVLMPVLNKLALSLNVNPLYLMLPTAVTCSYAFMLPVATPPNAIIFSAAEDMKTSTMMKVGFGLNIICVIVVTIMINTLGVAMFDLNSVPAWVNSTTSV